jgi:hypothetical protein
MTCEVSWAYTLSSRGGGTNYHYDKGGDGEVLLSDSCTVSRVPSHLANLSVIVRVSRSVSYSPRSSA